MCAGRLQKATSRHAQKAGRDTKSVLKSKTLLGTEAQRFSSGASKQARTLFLFSAKLSASAALLR
jgi:hypothetical protein